MTSWRDRDRLVAASRTNWVSVGSTAGPAPVSVHARERGLPDLGGHPSEALVVVVAVPPLAEVDLRDRVEPDGVERVDEQADLDAVAGGERQALQQRAAGGVLAGERLHEAGELRPVQVEQRTRDQLGDATAAPGVDRGCRRPAAGRRSP